MAGATGSKEPTHTENWQTLNWKQFQRYVVRLQQRIYQAERRGDYRQVNNLQSHCGLHGLCFETGDVIQVHRWNGDRLNNR